MDKHSCLAGVFFWLWAATCALIMMALLTSCNPWRPVEILPGQVWVYVWLSRDDGPLAQTNTVISFKRGVVEYESVQLGRTNRERNSYETFLYGSVRIK